MGTPFYMAPEMYTNPKEADKQCDIFSLGRILWDMYTGPATSAFDMDVLPSGIFVIVKKCMKSNPEERFQTVKELRLGWQSVAFPPSGSTDFEELKQAVNELRLSPVPAAEVETIDRVFEMMLQHADDGELIHDVVMELNAEVFTALYEKDSDAMREIIDRFVEHTNGISWGISYTDSLGNMCKVIYLASDDCQIRAALLHCIFEVGYSHTRWHLMGLFKELMESAMVAGEADILVGKLGTAASGYLETASNQLTLAKIDRKLSSFFRRYKADDE